MSEKHACPCQQPKWEIPLRTIAPGTVSLEDQIRCVEREIGMRHRVYPAWVRSGKMKEADATRELDTMNAVLKTLKGLAGDFVNQPELL